MSDPCPCGPYQVRVIVPAEPAVVRQVVPGGVGPVGPPGSGGGFQATAGMALSGHRAVRPASDGRLIYASCLIPGDTIAAVGITIGASDENAPANVLSSSDVTEPSWAWAPGLPVWIGPGGTLVQPAPASGDLRSIGVALSPTRLSLTLSSPLIRP